MQKPGSGWGNLVGAGVSLPLGASWDSRHRWQATSLGAAPASWTNERAELERAQRAHARSLMMLVHELRSPAVAAKCMAATCRSLDLQDSRRDIFLAKIQDRMDQLLDLVDDILDLSQARAGHPLGQTSVRDLVAETGAACGPYLEASAGKGLAMRLDLPDSPLHVRMAERAYRLIVSNLVSNAVKYTHTGSVRVTLRQEGPWAVLTVQDTGIGIPAAETGNLFVEFFRASNARAEHAPGSGLGLATVKALVEASRGELELDSHENQGSTFTVRLPRCEPIPARSSCPAGVQQALCREQEPPRAQ